VHRISKKNIAWLFLATGVFPSCFVPTAYKSTHLDGEHGATIIARVAKVGGRSANQDHRFQVDIYRYDSSCPNISFRMTSSGYAGTVWIKERPREFVE